MANLEEFSQVNTPALEEFNTSVHENVPVNNRASNLNLAAHAAALSDDPAQVMSAYSTINAEVDLTGKSEAAEGLLNLVKEKNFNKSRQALVNFMVDPQYTDEQKQEAALGVLDVTSKLYSTNNMLSTEALSAPSGNESVEQEAVRVSLADSILEVNQYKNESQMILNSEIAKTDGNMTGQYADIFGYFLPFVESKYAGDIIDGLRNGEQWAYDESFSLLGSSKMDLKQMLESLPPEDRMNMTRSIVDMINKHSAIVMPDQNDYARVDYLRTVLEDGYYDTTSKWVDNVVSVLDLTLLGGTIVRSGGNAIGVGAQIAKGTRMTESAIRDVRRRMVKSRVQPTTVSQNYKDTNPVKAQATHEAAAEDITEEAAQALYGTGRTDAVANDILPEPAGVDGAVTNKVGTPENISLQSRTPDPDIMDFVDTNGALYYWESEKRQMRATVVNDFEQAKGLNARKEMFQVDSVGDGVKISAVYGPAQGGFTNAQDAVDMAKWALRDYGVSDDAITILQREGDSYVPVAREDWEAAQSGKLLASKRIELIGQEPSLVTHTDATGKQVTQTDIGSRVVVRRKPDFLVQVNADYKFSPADVAKWAEADVNYNIFDRINMFSGTTGAGSLQRHLLDAHSMLHPNITLGANVAVDKAAGLEKQLLEIGKGFADGYTKVSKDRQQLLERLIREANDKGIDFNYNKLVTDGLRPEEIKVLKDWRQYWDSIYWLENKDMARTLRARGFYEYVDEANDTRLFAKPVSRNRVGTTAKVYDPATGEIKTLRQDELNELYAKDGTVAQLRQPIQVGEDAAEYVASVNAPGKNYLRAISDSTQVLNYRKGYYSVHYKDPQFIVKVVTNKNGDVLYEKAVATAGNIKDADLMVRRMTATDGGRYYRRGDVKKMDMRGDDYWDLQQAGGRSAQRIRGKRLEDATNPVVDPSQSNILDPVDSLILSARSTSHRVAMRDMLEATKVRFMEQFKDFLPVDKFQQKVFPGNIADVKYRGGQTEDLKKLADAKTTYEYIKYLEDGYINSIDDGYKATLKMIADIAGNAGLKTAEKAATWMSEGRGPSAMGKNIAFNMYLATNPFRQFIVQSHQAVQLLANFPRWAISGRAVPQLTILTAMQLGYKPSKSLLKGAGMTMEQAEEMFKQFDRSGLAASIDKQNLIRGSLSDLADQVAKKDFKPLTYLRRVGFDAGENVNTMTSWLAHRDQAIREGRNLADSSVQDMITAKSRNYTYNMNAAGDMPYNQNALALVFQFMQVPHKALTLMTTNRVLTKAQKTRLVGFNAIMYTLPPAAMYSLFGQILPDDPAQRDAVVNGLEGAVLNKLLSLASGEETRVDWSGLSPVDMFGTYEFIHSLFTTDVGTIIASTPSGQLFFGNNPRITNFAKSAARYFNVIDDYQDPTTFSQVANDFAKLSSGYSNLFKASYMLEYGKKVNTLGGTTDTSVSRPEAIAQVFGFTTLDEAQRYWVNNEMYEKSKAYEDDVKAWYKDFKKHITNKDLNLAQQEQITRTYSEAWRVFGNDSYRAKQIIAQELRKDVSAGDGRMYQSIMRAAGIMSTDEVRTLVKALPGYNEAKKNEIMNTLDYIDSYKEAE